MSVAILLFAMLGFLGGIWPSLFTLLLLVSVPALIFAFVGLAKPGVVLAHPGWRLYLVASAMVAGISVTGYVSWFAYNVATGSITIAD